MDNYGDGLSAHLMIRDLLLVKLRKGKRTRVLSIKEDLESNRWIDEKYLKKLYKEYAVALRQLHDSEDKARRTKALKNLSLSEDEAEARREERLDGLRKRVNDLGI